MQIRPAQPADFAQWLPLWQGYQAFYQTEIPASVTALTWQRFMDPAEPMHCALAEEGGVLLGMVHFIYHRSCWTAGDYVYLQDLYTQPQLRGKGVGRALIEHVYASAAHEAAARVWWLTHESNLTAMQLYDRIAEKSGLLQYRKAIV
jgi:GNAT superfamily N-acetyltransferase